VRGEAEDYLFSDRNQAKREETDIAEMGSLTFDFYLYSVTIKPMAKRKKSKNGYSETGVLLESMNDQIRVIAEHILSINKKLGKLEAIEEAIKLTQENMEIMKMDIEFIKQGFKVKVDIDEFAALEKRVSKLESRL